MLKKIIVSVETTFFRYRLFFLGLFAGITIFLGYQASQLQVDSDIAKLQPNNHEFYTNFQNLIKPKLEPGTENSSSLIMVVLSTDEEDIYSKDTLEAIEKIHDTILYIPGVDRGNVLSLRSPNPQWIRLTVDGIENGNLMPQKFKGTEEQISKIRRNVIDSPWKPMLVGDDEKSTSFIVPLLNYDLDGNKVDAVKLSRQLEEQVREPFITENLDIKIIGQEKIIGDIIAGTKGVVIFFGIAFLVICALVFWYCKCLKSTAVLISCSLIAVVWQLGIVKLYGGGIDAYTLLRPFLIFAISVSHGVQMINAVGLERLSGHNGCTSAARGFRTLIIPGSLALISDAMGFLVLFTIDIPIIFDLAIGAAAGVAIIIITNMFLLPALLCYVDTSSGVKKRLKKMSRGKDTVAQFGSKLATKPIGSVVIVIASLLFVFGYVKGHHVKLGDSERGAAELHQDSRYNQDQIYIDDHYPIGIDKLRVYVSTPPDHAMSREVVSKIDELEWALTNTEGVVNLSSIASHTRQRLTFFYDLNWKWYDLPIDELAVSDIARTYKDNNSEVSMTMIEIFLADHKDKTMQRVINVIQQFSQENNNDRMEILLGEGPIARDYSTNRVIGAAQEPMLLMVHLIVITLCWLTFRSWRAALCIIVPLTLTTMLTHALMVYANIGLKLATLPIVALGVGIGVDYGIYIYGRLSGFLERGMDIKTAYFYTLKVTGKAVAFAGLTLSIGVSTWMFSALKFQADMGMMLTFMFLCNMVGALTILPALARFLN